MSSSIDDRDDEPRGKKKEKSRKPGSEEYTFKLELSPNKGLTEGSVQIPPFVNSD